LPATLASQNDPTLVALHESLAVLGGLALSTLIGIPVGRGVIKAVRTAKKLLDAGKTSAAEKAWDKISKQDAKAVVQWANKHNKGKLPKRKAGGGAVRPRFESMVHIPDTALASLLEAAEVFDVSPTTEAVPHPDGGLLVTLPASVVASLDEALRVNVAPYAHSHGKPPRGRGYWAFAFDGKNDIDDVWFAPGNLTYAEAKKAALAQAKKIKAKTISVQP
jgi:hypothetical protein